MKRTGFRIVPDTSHLLAPALPERCERCEAPLAGMGVDSPDGFLCAIDCGSVPIGAALGRSIHLDEQAARE